MKIERKNGRKQQTVRMAYIAGAFLCAGIVSALAGYCVAATGPIYCASAGGWDPLESTVQCNMGGGVTVTFYNGVYNDPVDIYMPWTTWQADTGVNGDKPGPVQTSGAHIYSVSNCVQSVKDITIYWVGCTGYVPDDRSGSCPKSGG